MIREPVVGVERIVSYVVKQRSMPPVRAGPGHNRNLCSRNTAKLWGRGRCLDPKLAHGIKRHKTGGAALHTEQRKAAAKSIADQIPCSQAQVGSHAVYCPIICIGA